MTKRTQQKDKTQVNRSQPGSGHGFLPTAGNSLNEHGNEIIGVLSHDSAL